jgi:hypothetical protein
MIWSNAVLHTLSEVCIGYLLHEGLARIKQALVLKKFDVRSWCFAKGGQEIDVKRHPRGMPFDVLQSEFVQLLTLPGLLYCCPRYSLMKLSMAPSRTSSGLKDS